MKEIKHSIGIKQTYYIYLFARTRHRGARTRIHNFCCLPIEGRQRILRYSLRSLAFRVELEGLGGRNRLCRHRKKEGGLGTS